MYIDGQTIILIGGIITALGVIVGLILKVHKFVLEVEMLEEEVAKLKKHHDEDMDNVVNSQKGELDEIKKELQILTYSVLACLKALRSNEDFEKDENVDLGIKKIEEHLNSRAHD